MAENRINNVIGAIAAIASRLPSLIVRRVAELTTTAIDDSAIIRLASSGCICTPNIASAPAAIGILIRL